MSSIFSVEGQAYITVGFQEIRQDIANILLASG